jgi:hypothetical protein
VLWSMRKVLAMQRHMKRPDGLGGIGGFGQLTSISADGITQRIIERWPDVLGAPLRPGPIDWTRWHADNPKPGTGRVPLIAGFGLISRTFRRAFAGCPCSPPQVAVGWPRPGEAIKCEFWE